MTSVLRFYPHGQVGCLYTEAIDLRLLGRLEVRRATDIRFDRDTQEWEVRDVIDDSVLHSDSSREACLSWERENLS